MEKTVRVRVGGKYPGELPMRGMTTAEQAASLAFKRKPVAVKLAMIEVGKASLARLHTSNKLKNPDEC